MSSVPEAYERLNLPGGIARILFEVADNVPLSLANPDRSLSTLRGALLGATAHVTLLKCA
jgi:hypothetical protein